jgi:PilZ domain-containing protein
MPFKNSHISIGRVEFRRDRRYPVPPLVIRITERDYAAVNWSLGGFQIDASDLALAVGDGVEGLLHMVEMGKSCNFMAEIIWTRGGRGEIGAKFTELAPNAVELLDGYMAYWLKRGRR